MSGLPNEDCRRGAAFAYIQGVDSLDSCFFSWDESVCIYLRVYLFRKKDECMLLCFNTFPAHVSPFPFFARPPLRNYRYCQCHVSLSPAII